MIKKMSTREKHRRQMQSKRAAFAKSDFAMWGNRPLAWEMWEMEKHLKRKYGIR